MSVLSEGLPHADFGLLLEQSPSALMLVDAARSIVWRNKAAEALLLEGKIVHQHAHQRLVLGDQALDKRLDTMIAAAESDPLGSASFVLAPQVLEPLEFWSIVFHRIGRGSGGAGYLVQIRLRSAVSTPDARILRETFRLTRKEADVVAALACGRTLADYAEGIGNSIETLKWHLKNAMEKMRCNSKTELLLLVEMTRLTL